MFQKMTLAMVPIRLFRWIFRQEMKVHLGIHHLILMLAIRRALQTFGVEHPHWANSLFDEYFLRGEAAPLWAEYVRSGQLPSARDLARAWLGQLGPIASSSSGKQLPEVAQIAADFLAILECELKRFNGLAASKS